MSIKTLEECPYKRPPKDTNCDLCGRYVKEFDMPHLFRIRPLVDYGSFKSWSGNSATRICKTCEEQLLNILLKRRGFGYILQEHVEMEACILGEWEKRFGNPIYNYNDKRWEEADSWGDKTSLINIIKGRINNEDPTDNE